MTNLIEKMISWCEKEIAKRNAILSKNSPHVNSGARKAQYQKEILEEILEKIRGD